MKYGMGIAALAAALMASSAIPAFADVTTGAGTKASPAKLSSYGETGSLAFPVSGLTTEPGKGGTSVPFTYDYYFEFDTAAMLTGVTASSSSTSGKFFLPNVAFSSLSIVGLFTDPQANTPGVGAAFYPGLKGLQYDFAANTVYQLIVSGSVNDVKGSNANGTFNGNLTVSSLSTVPLPSSVAMFGMALVGLGAFGAVRRKKVSASVA